MGAHPGAVHARMAEGDPAVVTGPEPGGVSLMAIECSERPRRPREWRRGMATPGERRDMRTVPLHGKKAAGRVAVVDDEDYELVSPYRWHVLENPRLGRINGPYAAAGHSHVLMHNLILGVKGVDHINHDGLDNRRPKFRPPPPPQQHHNKRPLTPSRAPLTRS